MNGKEQPVEGVQRELLKNIITKEFRDRQLPDEIFILSGGIVKKSETQKPEDVKNYRSAGYSDNDLHGHITGASARVLAAAQLGEVFPELQFVTTSKIEKDTPSHAAVMQNELIEQGIDPDRIMLEEKSINTVTELVEMIKLAVANKWSRVSLMTSSYHIPRVKAMLEKISDIIAYDDEEFVQSLAIFRKRGIELSYLSAEEILSVTDPNFASFIAGIKQTSSYQGRLEAERKGLEDLMAGKYKVYSKPEEYQKKYGV